MLKDLKSNLKIVSCLLPAVRTADANGAAVDLEDALAAQVLVHLGAPGDTLSTSLKMELELEHSDDNSTWSDCADADLSAAVVGGNTGTFAVVDANAEASQAYSVGYKGAKRYIRVVYNITGTHTNGTPGSSIAMLSPKHLPVV